MILSTIYHNTRTYNRIPGGADENLRASGVLRITAVALLVLTTGYTVVVTAAGAQTTAKSATEEFVNQAMQILRDKQKSVLEKRRELKPLMEARFDSTEMAKSTLGYHWRTLSPDHQTNCTHLFTA